MYIVPLVTSGESLLKAGQQLGSLEKRKKSVVALAPIDDSTAERTRPRDEEEEQERPSYFERDNEPVESSNGQALEDDLDLDSKLDDVIDEGD